MSGHGDFQYSFFIYIPAFSIFPVLKIPAFTIPGFKDSGSQYSYSFKVPAVSIFLILKIPEIIYDIQNTTEKVS